MRGKLGCKKKIMAHDYHIEIGLIPGSNNAGIFFFVLGVH